MTWHAIAFICCELELSALKIDTFSKVSKTINMEIFTMLVCTNYQKKGTEWGFVSCEIM